MKSNALPPPIEGARIAAPLDAMRISWWAWRGRRYTARASGGLLRPARMAAAWARCVAWPIGTAVRGASIRFGRARYYFSRADTAVVAVKPTRAGWVLTDYCSEHPGHGEGWWLRQWVLPAVYDAADRAGITVNLTRTPAPIAEACAAETPGLRGGEHRGVGNATLARTPTPRPVAA